MLRVGLTGGYATGKSFVAAEFERLGCHVIYADKLGHEVLLRSGEAYVPVQLLFGSKILSANGDIDRKTLGELVFKDPDLLQRLTAIIHPAVYRLEQRLVEQYAAADPHAIVITEAAILIETGRYKTFDRLVVTYCSEETQISRGMKRDHVSRKEVLDRLARQMPAAEKQRYADYVVNTDRQKDETVAQVRIIFEELRVLASR
ncbi:MAG TPA: dephospho-CoA kinase [Bryobacteraceae bacterium]|jgi:dephospho-CoA kinase